MSRGQKHGYHHAMKLESALHQTLALDIGGANIKACYTDHTGVLHAFSQPFLLSHHVDELVEALQAPGQTHCNRSQRTVPLGLYPRLCGIASAALFVMNGSTYSGCPTSRGLTAA